MQVFKINKWGHHTNKIKPHKDYLQAVTLTLQYSESNLLRDETKDMKTTAHWSMKTVLRRIENVARKNLKSTSM